MPCCAVLFCAGCAGYIFKMAFPMCHACAFSSVCDAEGVPCCAVLLQAGRLFKQLEDMGQESLKKGGLDFKKVQLHAKFCVDNTPKVNVAAVLSAGTCSSAACYTNLFTSSLGAARVCLGLRC